MTQFLKSDVRPDGFKLEDLLRAVRNDVLYRSTIIMDDHRAEARQVLDNNVRILGYLSDAIALAESSTRTLDRSFGPHVEGQPRIGSE
ncbi:MAG: histidine kinase [Geminicoccaceae bacterium]